MSACNLRGRGKPKDGFRVQRKGKSWQVSSLLVPRTDSSGDKADFSLFLNFSGLDIVNTNLRMTSFYVSLKAIWNPLKLPRKQIKVLGFFFPFVWLVSHS